MCYARHIGYPEPVKRLTETHLRSIELELAGEPPAAIQAALDVLRATWYRWSREPVYQAELQAQRRRRLEEASDAVGARLSARFRDLDEVLRILLTLARDEDVPARDRIRASAEHGRLVCQSATLALGIAKATAPVEVEQADVKPEDVAVAKVLNAMAALAQVNPASMAPEAPPE